MPDLFADCLFFPCHPNKHPATLNGFHDAAPYRDPAWRTVGMVLVGNLFVLDIDLKEGKRGDLSLAALEEQYGDLSPTLGVRTPSGGYHFYFQVQEGVQIPSSNGKIGKDLDIRGNMHDGFVIAPGSWVSYTTKSGAKVEGFYEWL